MPGPLLVAGPDTLLLQLDHPEADQCRAELAVFAELERSPGHVHTYRLTDLGLWNAKAAGLSPDSAVETLRRYCTAGPVPQATITKITETMGRFGRILLESPRQSTAASLIMSTDEPDLLDQLLQDPSIAKLTGERLSSSSVALDPKDRGQLKQALTGLRWPADDRAALSPGVGFPLDLRTDAELRPYQRQAVDSWKPSGTGVVVLPCGAGKTITAIAAASEISTNTLILVTGQASLTQWERELKRFTTIDEADIGLYNARRKEVRPVTIATYQVMATKRDGRFRHLEVIQNGDWGLVIYDEVHLLPSAVFNLTAGIQARRRLGLTATLIREDGREADVFTLVGPKRFDVPWSDLELQGWIAPARCVEVRVVATDEERLAHAKADQRAKASIAATVAAKAEVAEAILARHPNEPTLVIGTYLDGLAPIAKRLSLPLVTGATPNGKRLELFDQLRRGELQGLVVSKVANFSLDLPEVSLAVQVSGSFGSRQEEAQRLGRILRPKHDGRQATFYSLVTRDTVEQDHSRRRQRFLSEQGYHYEIVDADDLIESQPGDSSGGSSPADTS